MYLLLDCALLHREEPGTLFLHARSAALAGSLVKYNKHTEEKKTKQRTLFLTRRASIWSLSTLVRLFSAFALWMYSISTRLFLNTLPFDFWYSEWYLSPHQHPKKNS